MVTPFAAQAAGPCIFAEKLSVVAFNDPVVNIKMDVRNPDPWPVQIDYSYEILAIADNGTVMNRWPDHNGPSGEILWGHLLVWTGSCFQTNVEDTIVLPREFSDGTVKLHVNVWRGAKLMQWEKSWWELPWAYPGQVEPALPTGYNGVMLTASNKAGGKGFVAFEVLTAAGWLHQTLISQTFHETRAAIGATGTDWRVLLVNGAGAKRPFAKFTWNGTDYLTNPLGYATIPAAQVLPINAMYVK
ncbi:MAG: hypothetical protein Q8N84_04320 [bacterium]|nr:hypothetical protein [bacterium]